MAGITEQAVRIRELAARGKFADAREALYELSDRVSESPETNSALAAELPKLARTLEVLESVDVVRGLLKAKDSQSAAEAASRILERLAEDEYAQLGVSGAAITLLSRASELARRGSTAETDAFVDYLGGEMNDLTQRRFDVPLQRSLREPSARTASTLGDLLNRKPWRSGLQPTVQDAPEAQGSTAHVPTVEKMGEPGGAPVLGKILIEQEPRAGQAAPQTQTSGGADQTDIFDFVGRATLDRWYVVLGTALVFSLLGYLITVAQPTKYQATALLQKTAPSPLRAPITNETTQLAPTMPREAVAEMTRILSFFQDIEKKLASEGWAPTQGPNKGIKQPLTALTLDDIALALKSTVKDLGSGSYLIEFSATHTDPNTAQAVADTAARVFKDRYRYTLVREPQANLDDYKKRGTDLERELEGIKQQKLNEFYIAPDSEAAGLSTEERTRLLMEKLGKSRAEHARANLAVAAAKLELRDFEDQLRDTEPTIPNPRAGTGNPQLDALYAKLEQVTDELLDLDRKRSEFGPKHPIHDKITELRAQRAELLRRVEQMEEETGVRRATIQNPAWVTAGLRVKEAKARLGASELEEKHWSEEAARIEKELNGLREKYLASAELTRRESELQDQLKRNKVVQEDLESVIATADRELQEVQWSLRASPLEPKTLVGIAVGLVVGLVVGVAIAIALLRRHKLGEAA